MENKWSRYYSSDETISNINVGRTIYKVLCDSAEMYPDRIAIEHAKRNFTYAQLKAAVDNTAAAFRSAGIGKGDVIALCINGTPATVFTLYAASALGAIVSMVSEDATQESFRNLCSSQKIKAAVLSPNLLNVVYSVLDRTDIKNVIIVKHTDYFTFNDRFKPLVRKLLPLDSLRVKASELPSDVSMFFWKDLLADYAEKRFAPEPDVSPNSAVVFMNGAAATGRVLSASLSSRAMNEQASMDLFLYKTGDEKDRAIRVMTLIDRCYSCGMCFGIHSIIAAGNTACLYVGDMSRFPVESFGFYKPDIVIGYPGLLVQMAESKIINFADTSFLKKIISCGNIMNTAQCYDLRSFIARSKCNAVLERFYGIDETGAAYIYNPVSLDNDRIFGIPLPGVLVKIMDPDSEAEMRPGEQGQICVCTPAAMGGYVDNEPATGIVKKRFKDGRVWICTGDTGHEDDNGLIYFDGNTKRIFERNGTLIYPYIIEESILGVNGVKEACAVSIDEDGITYLVAVVVPEDDYLFDAARLEELKNAIETECNLTLSPVMRPDEIEFRAYLPKENFGKSDHDAIRAQIMARRSGEDEQDDQEDPEELTDDML